MASHDEPEIDNRNGDKYAVAGAEIDCGSRLHLCLGACCRLRFALSEQDIGEGIVAWDPAEPYLNLQRADRWCAHSDEEERTCGVYENRPAPCRVYDCRDDIRIWLDFEAREPNPHLLQATVAVLASSVRPATAPPPA